MTYWTMFGQSISHSPVIFISSATFMMPLPLLCATWKPSSSRFLDGKRGCDQSIGWKESTQTYFTLTTRPALCPAGLAGSFCQSHDSNSPASKSSAHGANIERVWPSSPSWWSSLARGFRSWTNWRTADLPSSDSRSAASRSAPAPSRSPYGRSYSTAFPGPATGLVRCQAASPVTVADGIQLNCN